MIPLLRARLMPEMTEYAGLLFVVLPTFLAQYPCQMAAVGWSVGPRLQGCSALMRTYCALSVVTVGVGSTGGGATFGISTPCTPYAWQVCMPSGSGVGAGQEPGARMPPSTPYIVAPPS